MKKLEKSLGEHLPPVKIYREDIEDIYNVFKEVSSEIEIKADGFMFENLDELFSHPRDKIKSLNLLIRNPYVSIDFKPSEIFLFSMDDTSVQVGLYEKIKSIVKKRRNWAFSLITSYLSWFIAGVSITEAAVYLKRNGLQYLTEWAFIFRAFILMICLAWLFYGFKIEFKKHSQIFLRYKKSETSFLKRNTDTIIISTIFLIMSTVVAFLLK